MDDTDLIFKKWPNWLRWILFLPLSILSVGIFGAIAGLSVGYIGYNPNSTLIKAIIQYGGVAGSICVAYLCVPRFKELITGIISLSWALFKGAITGIYLVYGYWRHWDFFITLALAIFCVVFGLYLIVEHGKNIAFSNSAE